MAGLILVGSLVIFAFLAGGVVIHRLDATPTAGGQQEEQQAEQGETDQGESKPKKANNGQGNSKDVDQADDAEKESGRLKRALAGDHPGSVSKREPGAS